MFEVTGLASNKTYRKKWQTRRLPEKENKKFKNDLLLLNKK